MTVSKPSVFVSYARDDDEPFVARLHKGLGDAGIASAFYSKAEDSATAFGQQFLGEFMIRMIRSFGISDPFDGLMIGQKLNDRASV